MTEFICVNITIKQRLQNELKENFFWYMKLLHRWFRQQISKEEFDKQARSLFPNSDMTTHNRFILSIMSSCKIIEPTAPMSKSLRHRFVEQPQVALMSLIADYRQEAASAAAAAGPLTPGGGQNSLTLSDRGGARRDFSLVTTSCTREQRLPGAWMLYGRMMHTLSLYALQDFSTEALNYLALAAQCLTRRVLLSALANRRNCRIFSINEISSQRQQQQQQQIRRGAGGVQSSAASSATLTSYRRKHCLQSATRRRLERAAFGRAPPATPFPLREAYSAPARAAGLNAYTHAARFATASTAAAVASARSADWQRVDALLRCGCEASPEASAASDSSMGSADSANFTVLNLEDLERVLSRPDTLSVGYHCVQRQRQAVSSALLRSLTRNRLLVRMRQQQQQTSISRSSIHSLPMTTQQVQTAPFAATTSEMPQIPASPVFIHSINTVLPNQHHPITNGVCVMDSGGGELAHLAADVVDGYEDCLM